MPGTLGLIASSHRVYRRPLLRHKSSNVPFAPLHPALEAMLRGQPRGIGVAPVSQVFVLWNTLTVDGSALVLLTPTCLYRIPTTNSASASSAITGSNDNAGVTCVPLEFIVRAQRDVIPYASTRASSFETVRLYCRPSLDSASTGSRTIAVSCTITGSEGAELNRILQAVNPSITWGAATAGASSTDGAVEWNPATVVYPLSTFADVALREGVDERCEMLADRLRIITDAFHVSPPNDSTSSSSGSSDHWAATCKSDVFVSCVMDAQSRLPTRATTPADWAVTKERLVAQTKAMDDELMYLRTQVDLLTNNSFATPRQQEEQVSLDADRHEALYEAVRSLAANPSAAARDRFVASLSSELRRHEGTVAQLNQLRSVIAWAGDMPQPLVIQQQLTAIQDKALVLEGTLSRNIANGRCSAQVTPAMEALSAAVKRLGRQVAGRDQQTSTDAERGQPQSMRSTQRALEESLRVISQHRQAEQELSASLDAARVALLQSQYRGGVMAERFIRWLAWTSRKRNDRLAAAAATDAERQQSAQQESLEMSQLRTQLQRMEEEAHATAAAVAAERAKLQSAMQEERLVLADQIREAERRGTLLREHIHAMEADTQGHLRRIAELEGLVSTSQRQALDAFDAQRTSMQAAHEAQLDALQSEIRQLNGRLRDADAVQKLEASKWEDRLEMERIESATRKRADVASARAAMEDELNAFQQRTIAAQRQRDAAIAQVSSLQADVQQLHEQTSELRVRSAVREKETATQHDAEMVEVTKRWNHEIDQLREEQRRLRNALDEANTAAANSTRRHKEEVAALQAEVAEISLGARRDADARDTVARQLRAQITELEAQQGASSQALERERELTAAARAEVQQLRAQVAQVSEAHAQSLSQLASVERTSSNLSQEAKQTAAHHAEELTRMLSEQRQQLQDAVRESDRRQAALDASDRTVGQLTAALHAAQLDVRKYMVESAGALEMLRDLEEELSVVHVARQEAAAALPELQAKYEQELAHMASRHQALLDEHSQCAMEREQLLADSESAAQVAASKLQRHIKAAEERESALQREVDSRDGRLHDAMTERQSLHQELRESMSAVKESQAKEAQLRRTLAMKESEYEQQHQEQRQTASTQETLFASLTEQLRNLEAQLGAATASRDTLRSQLTRTEEEHHRLQRLTDSLKSTASQKETDLVRIAEADRARLKTLHEHELKDAHAEIAKALQQVEAATSRAAHATHESKLRQDQFTKQHQKLSAEVAEAKQQQKQAQSESVAQGEMLKDMEEELAGVHVLLRDKVQELHAAEEMIYRLEQERDDWERRTQRMHNERLRTESTSKEELQQLQTALLTLSQESELREHQLTEALERMTSHSTEDRAHERQQYEQRVFALQSESEALRVDRDDLARKFAAAERRVDDLQATVRNCNEMIARLEGAVNEKSQLALRLDPAMQLASELERELALQFKKEKALTVALEDSAQRMVALHEENRSLQLQVERVKQDHASLMMGNDSALSTVRSERGKLLTVHEEELRIERERARRLERERDDWNSERLELQRDYEGKLQRSYELEKSRIAELSASWEVEREKIRRDHDAQLDILRRGCQTAERRADNLLSEVGHKNEMLLSKERQIEALEQHLKAAAVEAKEQEAMAAYRLNAALEVLNDVEVEASYHERSIVSTTEEVTSLRAALANVGDVEKRLQDTRAEGQVLMMEKFRLEEDLSERAIEHERLTSTLRRTQEDLQEVRQRLQLSQAENEQFALQLAAQAQHIRDIAEANNTLSQETKQLAAQRTDTEAKWDTRVAALAVEREQMRAMHEEQVTTLHQKIHSHEVRHASLRDENDSLCKQIASDEALIGALRGEVEEAERSLVRLHKQLQMQEQELHNAHDELAKIDFLPRGALSERPTAADTVRLLSEDLRQLLLEKKKAADREELLVRQLRELQNTHLTENDQNVAMCLDVIAGLESDVAELQRERDALQSELIEVRADRSTTSAAAQNLRDEVMALQEQLAEVQTLNSELEEEAEAAIEESQQLALKMEELDEAMHAASEEQRQVVEDAHTSRQTTLKSLEGHLEQMIIYAKSVETKHRDELDELQHQLDCAEAVFQGLNVSLTDKTARLEYATTQLGTLKEEHLQELKRVRERYAVSLREKVDAEVQTLPSSNDRHDDMSHARSVASRSAPRAGSGERSSSNQTPVRGLALPSLDEMMRSPAIQAAFQSEHAGSGPGDAKAAVERAQQLTELLAIERMNTQLATDEVEVLTRSIAQLHRELQSVQDHSKSTSADVAKRSVEVDELRFENDMLKRRFDRVVADHERDTASLTAHHDAAAQRLAVQHDEQTKRLLARLIDMDDALNAAYADRTQYKDKLKLMLEETAHTVTMLTETEMSAKSREADLEFTIRNMQAKLSGAELELEVQHSVVANLRSTQEATMADSQERMKNVASALHAARLETETFRQKISDADRRIEHTLQELQRLTDEYEHTAAERDHLSVRLAEVDAAHQRTIDAFTDTSATLERITQDRDALYRIVTEAAETSTAIAEERDRIAAEFDKFMQRPRVARAAQTEDAFRTSSATQYDVLSTVHLAVQCTPSSSTASTTTELTATRDIGIDTSGLVATPSGSTGVRSPLQDAAVSASVGTITDQSPTLPAATQTVRPEHASTSTQRIVLTTASTLTDAPPVPRSVGVGEPLEDATRNKYVQTNDIEWVARSESTTAYSQTPAAPEVSLAATQTIPDMAAVTTQTPALPDLHPAGTQTPVKNSVVARGSQCASPMAASNATQTILDTTTRGCDTDEALDMSFPGIGTSPPLFGGLRASPDGMLSSSLLRTGDDTREKALPPAALVRISPQQTATSLGTTATPRLQESSTSPTRHVDHTPAAAPGTTPLQLVAGTRSAAMLSPLAAVQSPSNVQRRFSPRVSSSLALSRLRREKEIDDVIIAEPMHRSHVHSDEAAARRALHQEATSDIVALTALAVARAAEVSQNVQTSLELVQSNHQQSSSEEHRVRTPIDVVDPSHAASSNLAVVGTAMPAPPPLLSRAPAAEVAANTAAREPVAPAVVTAPIAASPLITSVVTGMPTESTLCEGGAPNVVADVALESTDRASTPQPAVPQLVVEHGAPTSHEVLIALPATTKIEAADASNEGRNADASIEAHNAASGDCNDEPLRDVVTTTQVSTSLGVPADAPSSTLSREEEAPAAAPQRRVPEPSTDRVPELARGLHLVTLEGVDNDSSPHERRTPDEHMSAARDHALVPLPDDAPADNGCAGQPVEDARVQPADTTVVTCSSTENSSIVRHHPAPATGLPLVINTSEVSATPTRTPRSPRRQVSAELSRLRCEKLLDDALVDEAMVRSSVVLQEAGDRNRLREACNRSAPIEVMVIPTEVAPTENSAPAAEPTVLRGNAIPIPTVAPGKDTPVAASNGDDEGQAVEETPLADERVQGDEETLLVHDTEALQDTPVEPSEGDDDVQTVETAAIESKPDLAQSDSETLVAQGIDDVLPQQETAATVGGVVTTPSLPTRALDAAVIHTHLGTDVAQVMSHELQHTAALPDNDEIVAPSAATVQEAKAQPTTAIESAVAQPTAAIESAVAQPTAAVESAVAQPTAAIESAVAQPTAAVESAVAQRTAAIEDTVAQRTAAIEDTVAQPTAAIEDALAYETPRRSSEAVPASAPRTPRSSRRQVGVELERLRFEKLLDDVMIQEPIARVGVASIEVRERRALFATYVCDQPRPAGTNPSPQVATPSEEALPNTTRSPAAERNDTLEARSTILPPFEKQFPEAVASPQPVAETPTSDLRRPSTDEPPSRRRMPSSSRATLFDMHQDQQRADVLDEAAVEHAVILNQEHSFWKILVEVGKREYTAALLAQGAREAQQTPTRGTALAAPAADTSTPSTQQALLHAEAPPHDAERHSVDDMLMTPEGLSPITDDTGGPPRATIVHDDAAPLVLELTTPDRTPQLLSHQGAAAEPCLPELQQATTDFALRSAATPHFANDPTHAPFGETVNGLGAALLSSRRSSSAMSSFDTQRSLSPPQRGAATDVFDDASLSGSAAQQPRILPHTAADRTVDLRHPPQAEQSSEDEDQLSAFLEEESPHHRHYHVGTTMDSMFLDETADQSFLLLEQEAHAPQGPATLGQTTPTRYPGMSSSPPPLLASARAPTAPVTTHHDPQDGERWRVVDAMDDYDLCVQFANEMELMEEDEFLEWTDIVQLEEAECLQLQERMAMYGAAATEEARRFVRFDNDVDAAMSRTSPNHDGASHVHPLLDTNDSVPRWMGADPSSTTTADVGEESERHADVEEVMELETTTIEALLAAATPTVPTAMVAKPQQGQPPSSRFPSRHDMRQHIVVGGPAPARPAASSALRRYVPATTSASPSNSSYISGTRSVSNTSQPQQGGPSLTPARHRSPGASSSTARMAPYFVAGRNTMVLKQTPLRKSVGAKLSSDHIAEMLAAMTSERDEALETTARVQTIASLMSKSRPQR